MTKPAPYSAEQEHLLAAFCQAPFGPYTAEVERFARWVYQTGALWFTGMLLIASTAVPIALRRHIPLLRRRADAQLPPATAVLRNLLETYSNPSILALLAAAVFLAAASGLTNAIWVYLYSFYWACTSNQVNVIQAVYLLAAVVALFWLPRLSRGVDKRALTLQISTAFWIFTAMPYALRSVRLFPDSASPWKMYLLSLHGLIDGVLFNMLMALLFSLLADVVEESLANTGRREEGLILASQTFVSKVSTAAGTWLASGILAVIAFPRGGAASSLSAHILFQLGTIYTATMWTVGILSTIYLRRYKLTRHAFHLVLQRVAEK